MLITESHMQKINLWLILKLLLADKNMWTRPGIVALAYLILALARLSQEDGNKKPAWAT